MPGRRGLSCRACLLSRTIPELHEEPGLLEDFADKLSSGVGVGHSTAKFKADDCLLTTVEPSPEGESRYVVSKERS